MTQPTTPVAYSDGKGTRNVYCLACPRPPEATVGLTVEDIDHWETCRACGRYVVDAARTVTTDPKPTTPAPVDPALRARVAEVIRPWLLGADEADIGHCAAMVLAELAPELARAHDAAQQQRDHTAQTEGRLVELADALGLQAQRGMLGWPALIEAVRTLRALKDDHRTRAQQLEELLDIAHATSNRSEAERAAAVERAEQAETALTEVRALLADLTDPDPCWYDHHGYCQAHGWFATEPACPHARAKALTGPAEENTP